VDLFQIELVRSRRLSANDLTGRSVRWQANERRVMVLSTLSVFFEEIEITRNSRPLARTQRNGTEERTILALIVLMEKEELS